MTPFPLLAHCRTTGACRSRLLVLATRGQAVLLPLGLSQSNRHGHCKQRYCESLQQWFWIVVHDHSPRTLTTPRFEKTLLFVHCHWIDSDQKLETDLTCAPPRANLQALSTHMTGARRRALIAVFATSASPTIATSFGRYRKLMHLQSVATRACLTARPTANRTAQLSNRSLWQPARSKWVLQTEQLQRWRSKTIGGLWRHLWKPFSRRTKDWTP